MVLVYIENINNSTAVLESGLGLSVALKKELGIIFLVEQDDQIKFIQQEIKTTLEKINISENQIIIRQNKLSELSDICEELEASFLLMQLSDNRSRIIQKYLNACRGLRIPYLIFKDTFPVLSIRKVLVPVTFLEEDYEKAQFASAFGRFYGAGITLLLANDYGSKAANTANKMEQLFDKFDLNYVRQKAEKDSFKVEKESVQIAQRGNFDIIIISASREYGLDDLLFGPKEQHIIKASDIPVLLVNPRGDLYALCD